MRVKKVLSLLTLIFLVFFLVIPAFPDGDPTDADPWNETISEPDPRDANTVIIVIGSSYTPLVPYFVMMKIQLPSAPKITEAKGSTPKRGSGLAGR